MNTKGMSIKVTTLFAGLLFSALSFGLSEPTSKTAFANTMKYAGNTATIRAVGLRKKFVFKVYAFGLYAKPDASRANLFSPQSGLGLEMKMLRTVNAKDITDAINESVKPRLSKGDLGQLPKFASFFKGKIKQGDSLKFVWTNKGLAVLQNNSGLGTVSSHGFAAAFFKIYLGNKPLLASAKQQFMASLK